ncbi:MAG: LysM peptidoglycan-binding domain-containing protein [Eubacteriales bacterium]|nr:LysM peptidoglycan-binding domain-containing protein [Eubacteriales bacterium]
MSKNTRGKRAIMRTSRLHVKSKRKRTVYLKKMALFMAAFVFAVCFSVLSGSELVSAHGSQQEAPVDYRYYKSIKVDAGDTLWSIAERYMDDTCDSIPEYIEILKEINQLESTEIHEGRYLTVAYTDQVFH